LPAQTVYAADDGGTITAYLVGPGGFAEWDALLTAYIVGAWDMDQEATDGYLQAGQTFDGGGSIIGTPTYPLQPDYTAYIRPLGNKAGRATGALDSVRWAGHPEAKWLNDDDRYTVDDHPFTLHVVREENTYPAWDSGTTYALGDKTMHAGTGWQSQQINTLTHEPGQPGSGPWWLATEFGWGWTCTVIPPLDTQRDIQNRKVTVYTELECINVLYSTGSFNDVAGTWTTVAPSGNWTATPDDVYFALTTVGNVQEGCWSLLDGSDETTAEFWDHDQ
jgi:hypothetical protein